MQEDKIIEKNSIIEEPSVNSEKKIKIKEKNNLKKIIGIAVSVIVALGLVAVFVFYLLPEFIMPSVYLNKAIKSFENSDYSSAITYYEKSEKIETDKEANNNYTYATAMIKFEEEKYVEASNIFKGIETHLEAKDKIYECGIKLLVAEKYKDAATVFEKATVKSGKSSLQYAKALENFTNGSYADAKKYFENYVKYGEVEEIKSLDLYVVPSEYMNRCDILLAEADWDEGNLNSAKKKFSKLPKDYSYEGINVSDRLKTLNKNKAFLDICGKWRATDNDIITKNYYKRTGSWDSWAFSDLMTNQTITVRCIPNGNKMTIKGSVSFYKFTDYSSLSEYCDNELDTISFEIKDVNKVPSSYKLDSNTTLKYSNGKFSIDYYLKDNYSISFYNVYTSNVIYGKNVDKY